MSVYYQTFPLGGNIQIPRIHFHVIDSTSSWVKRHVQELAQYQRVCITATEQSAGRGRFGRRWLSPTGGIYASFFMVLSRCLNGMRWDPYLFNLGQMFTVSCARSLIDRGFPISIKYPNDLILGGRKVAGVLTESCHFSGGLGVVIGLGLNVNIPYPMLRQVDQPVTSLSHFSHSSWNQENLLGDIATKFFLCYEKSQLRNLK